MTGPLSLGDNKITDLANGTSSDDAVNKGQLDAVAAAASSALSNYVQNNDSRLTNSRTPTVHASSHLTGGSDAIQLATSSQPGLMSSTYASKLDSLRTGLFVKTSIAAMQAITTAQIGDICTVYDSTSDVAWHAVTPNKYTHGANCVTGSGVDWIHDIDRIAGNTTLSGGYRFVYLPGLTSAANARAGYSSIIGNPGTVWANATDNGIEIHSTAGADDGSQVWYEVTAA